MADPVPVVSLDISHIPNTPITMRDVNGKELLVNGSPILDRVWIEYFIALYNRVGGSSGDIIYNNTTIGTLVDGAGDGSATQQFEELANIVGNLQEQNVAGQQIAESLKKYLEGAFALQQEATASGQQISDLDSRIDNQSSSTATQQQIEELRNQIATVASESESQEALQRLAVLESIVFDSQTAIDPHQIIADVPPISVTKRFDFGDASPKRLYEVPQDKFILSAKIIITTPFDGVGHALTIGDAGDAERLMQAAQNNASVARTYQTTPSLKYSTKTVVNIYITPGTATTGTGYVVLILDQ